MNSDSDLNVDRSAQPIIIVHNDAMYTALPWFQITIAYVLCCEMWCNDVMTEKERKIIFHQFYYHLLMCDCKENEILTITIKTVFILQQVCIDTCVQALQYMSCSCSIGRVRSSGRMPCRISWLFSDVGSILFKLIQPIFFLSSIEIERRPKRISACLDYTASYCGSRFIVSQRAGSRFWI